ncbi:MAG: hypothetical protein WAU70_02895 [Flavobacteriales bacterium]
MDSHNQGENCMNCHMPDGEGETCWQVAGTVFNSNGGGVLPNATLLLFTDTNGQGSLVRSLDFDGLGNVYTSEQIDFSHVVYPAVRTPAGDTVFMDVPIRDGACNRCHGVSTARITAP